MTKNELATMIEEHHLYSPMAQGVYSKRYYRYSPSTEINLLMRCTKEELEDMYSLLYGLDDRELTAHELNY